MAGLKARGFEFEDYDMPGEKSPSGVVKAGGAKAAWFKDSEGNILQFLLPVQRRECFRRPDGPQTAL